MQHTHYTSEFTTRQFPIGLVCDNVTNASNVGSLFRIADAFGIEQLIFCGKDFTLGRRFKKTSRSTENYVNFAICNDIFSVLNRYKESGYTINALEITSRSKPINNIEITNQPLVLILGDEVFGISESVLAICDNVFHINMFGKNTSMNVTQAASIALYEITKHLKDV